MKKLFSILISLFLYTSLSFADDKIALKYNIIAADDSKNNSVIDSKIQKKLNFKLFSVQGAVYFNNQEINIVDKNFEIDLTGLTGKQEIKFTNSENESVIFTYYISDENGLIQNYKLENEQAYVKTVNDVKILYTNKDSKKIDYVENIINKLPTNLKTNVSEIELLPVKHSSNAAGITNYNKITLYNLSNYSNSEIKRIIIHEITHTWAHDLRTKKIIDYSYTNYEKAVKKDNNYVTNYSKNSLSEDFADSVAYYLIDTTSFTKKFPARANYIKALM